MPVDFTQLFEDGRTVHCGKEPYRVHVASPGALVLPSGAIVACDPFVFPETKPFTQQVSPGTYPVALAVVHMGSDQRVAFARILFDSLRVQRWVMAVTPGQDLAQLPAGNFYGYPVDAGTGCFMDALAATSLLSKMDSDHDYFQTIIDEMQKTYRHTWSWANMTMDPTSKANLMAFSSGVGDGLYPSFWGLDDTGHPAQLVTDFCIVDETLPEEPTS